MGVVALLAWYDERPEFLFHTITSLKQAHVTHLIAADGAYALYPDGEPRSHIDQYAAIHDACQQTGIGATVHTPRAVWAGNEVEKRSKLFELADTVTEPGVDWLLIIDGDTPIKTAPGDLLTQLEATALDVAAVTVEEPHPDAKVKTNVYPCPLLFRAIPGMRVIGNHFTYVTPDGRRLWGNATVEDLEPRLDLAGLVVEHLTHFRTLERRLAAVDYYDRREETVAEDFLCCRPDCEASAKYSLPVHWHPNDGGFVAEWAWACRAHRELFANRGRYELSQHVGWERASAYYERQLWLTASDDLQVENRPGPVPA